jgi:hypothetical protein
MAIDPAIDFVRFSEHAKVAPEWLDRDGWANGTTSDVCYYSEFWSKEGMTVCVLRRRSDGLLWLRNNNQPEAGKHHGPFDDLASAKAAAVLFEGLL